MNYRHAFHAGNHADVLKHILLLACLDHLKKKPAPFAALDIHAGRGRYDLSGAEAARSPEWREGAGRIFGWADAPALAAPYCAALAAANPDGALRFYPGSPALIRAALRPSDRLIACELHHEESRALQAQFRGDRQAQIHRRDGWGALRALLPFPERRGLVLVDPPYEREGELALAARSIGAALARSPGCVFLWWRPLKDAGAVRAADAELRQRAIGAAGAFETLRVDLAVRAHAEGLAASSVTIVNPPFGLADALGAAMPALCERLAQSAGAAWRIH